MASKLFFRCSGCGYSSPKWLGKCPQCNEWNTFTEEVQKVSSSGKKEVARTSKEVHPLLSVARTPSHRLVTGIAEVDRVLGGGFEPSSLNLLSGEPGIGKSTLVLLLCEQLSLQGKTVLYVSGEESAPQVQARAERLGLKGEHISFLHAHALEDILDSLPRLKPDFLIVDSIQVISTEDASGLAGSISQVRYVTELLLEYTKTHGTTTLLIGHVTKDGTLAGPRVLEHLVDTVLMLEGEESSPYRVLRGLKNRFGSTDELGLFTMTEKGLCELKYPSKAFLEGRNPQSYGTAVTSIVEGNRSFLVEVQALTTYTKFGYPKRTSVGYDLNRLNIILAILGKYTKVQLDSYDVYVNIAGGLRSKDTSLDLAVAMSIVSSKVGTALPEHLLIMGELGLTGEVRSVRQPEKRLKEALQMGFTSFLLPPASFDLPQGVEFLQAKTITQALSFLYSSL